MEIDEKIVNISNKYIFKNIGNHTVYMRINLTDLNLTEFMFSKIKSCKHISSLFTTICRNSNRMMKFIILPCRTIKV